MLLLLLDVQATVRHGGAYVVGLLLEVLVAAVLEARILVVHGLLELVVVVVDGGCRILRIHLAIVGFKILARRSLSLDCKRSNETWFPK